MANDIFNFKQFSVSQNLAAMKVGTDGVLLGAWVSVEDVLSVLDIGTGTGLIALMIAQRATDAEIHALELEDAAYEQAVINFTQCPWAERLNAVHADFTTYKSTSKYDLIVSNPPFFNHSLKNACDKKTMARHTESLSYSDLIKGAAQMLSEHGRFCVVLPAEEKTNFQYLAAKNLLFLNSVLYVKPTPIKLVKRVLLQFSFQNTSQMEREMVIEEFGRHQYSDAYKALTSEFYLAF